MQLPSDPACVLVQMSATTLHPGTSYRRMFRRSDDTVAAARIASVAQTVRALLDEVPARAPESVQLQLVHSGSLVVRQGERQMRYAAGDLAVYDVSRPFEFLYPEPFVTTIVQLPTRTLGRDARIDALSAGPIPRGSTARAALERLLRDPSLHRGDLPRRGQHSRDVLAAARSLVRELVGTPSEDRAPAPGLAVAVLADVERRFADPTLSAATIAARLHVSVRTLHAAFEDRPETLRGTIRALRVAEARRLLSATALPVSEIALRVGYQDVTHFIRVFTRATGSTPGRWRREGGAVPSARAASG